jgi:hypothetical protein
MKKFADFLKDKAAVAQVADYKGPTPSAPPEHGKYPATPKSAGVKRTYKGKGEDPGQMAVKSDGTPLGEQPSPHITPDKAIPNGKKPAKKKVKFVTGTKKLKEFFDATAGLTDQQFVEYMMSQKAEAPEGAFVHDLHGNKFTPHPHETMSYLCSLMHNKNMVSRLVREMKEKGHLDKLVEELMDHPEFHKAVTDLLGHEEKGPAAAGKMAKAMHDHASTFRRKAGLFDESVAPALIDDEGSDGEGVIPKKDHDPDDNLALDDKGEEDDEAGDDEGEEGDEAPEDAEEGEEGEEETDGDEGGDDAPADGPVGPMPLPHNHMIGAMKKYFHKDMKKACVDGDC